MSVVVLDLHDNFSNFIDLDIAELSNSLRSVLIEIDNIKHSNILSQIEIFIDCNHEVIFH